MFPLGHELARFERGVQRLVEGILLRIVILKAEQRLYGLGRGFGMVERYFWKKVMYHMKVDNLMEEVLSHESNAPVDGSQCSL